MPNGKQNADWDKYADTDADTIHKMQKYPEYADNIHTYADQDATG
jgi:hypothetical protein